LITRYERADADEKMALREYGSGADRRKHPGVHPPGSGFVLAHRHPALA